MKALHSYYVEPTPVLFDWCLIRLAGYHTNPAFRSRTLSYPISLTFGKHEGLVSLAWEIFFFKILLLCTGVIFILTMEQQS